MQKGMFGYDLAIATRAKMQPGILSYYGCTLYLFIFSYYVFASIKNLLYIVLFFLLAIWWSSFGAKCKELQSFVICILSLTFGAT